jgi:hypothetical protein
MISTASTEIRFPAAIRSGGLDSSTRPTRAIGEPGKLILCAAGVDWIAAIQQNDPRLSAGAGRTMRMSVCI